MRKLEIPASLEHLETVNAYIDETVLGQYIPLIPHIKLAAEELLVNIFSYAYKDTFGNAEIYCNEMPGGILLSIRDWGPPFNPFAEAPPPDTTLDVADRPIGGLGVFLIKSLSADQTYRREGTANIIDLLFTLPAPGKEPPAAALFLTLFLGLALGVACTLTCAPTPALAAQGSILSEERETVVREMTPVRRIPRPPMATPQEQEAQKAMRDQTAASGQPQPATSGQATEEAGPVLTTSPEPEQENLLQSMDVYALSPHARFLSLAYRGPRPLYGTTRPTARYMPPSAARFLRDPGSLAGFIAEAGRRHGLPQALIAAVIQTESAYNPGAVSPKGAQGLMQIMPATQRELGLTNPHDPRANIMAGSQYLREQLDTFGSLELALAAYNAGPGNVLRHGGVPPFTETLGFVAKVLSLMDHQ